MNIYLWIPVYHPHEENNAFTSTHCTELTEVQPTGFSEAIIVNYCTFRRRLKQDIFGTEQQNIYAAFITLGDTVWCFGRQISFLWLVKKGDWKKKEKKKTKIFGRQQKKYEKSSVSKEQRDKKLSIHAIKLYDFKLKRLLNWQYVHKN